MMATPSDRVCSLDRDRGRGRRCDHCHGRGWRRDRGSGRSGDRGRGQCYRSGAHVRGHGDEVGSYLRAARTNTQFLRSLEGKYLVEVAELRSPWPEGKE